MSLHIGSGAVLEVVTELGKKYIEPSLAHRLRLSWIFRHFTTLSDGVLTDREREFVRRTVSTSPQRELGSFGSEHIIGTIDYTSTPRKPSLSDTSSSERTGGSWSRRTA